MHHLEFTLADMLLPTAACPHLLRTLFHDEVVGTLAADL